MGVAVGAGGWVAGLVATGLAVVVLVVLQATKPLTQRLGRHQATLELEYLRGHGTLGPLLRSLEETSSRVMHVAVQDDDQGANGEGVRRVTLDLGLRHRDDIDQIVDDVRSRPEVRNVKMADSDSF